MKLSEAIPLGSTQGLVKFNPGIWNTCLIGVAISAFRLPLYDVLAEALRRWPWLEEKFIIPSCLQMTPDVIGPGGDLWRRVGDEPMQALAIISAFASQIYAGNLRLEQALEWIQSVEPEEVGKPMSSPAIEGEQKMLMGV